LSAGNFVANQKGGLNVQVNDREYYMNGGGGNYVCFNSKNGIKCSAYITITGFVEEGTATAIEKHDHSANCPTLSEQYNDWMQRSQ
jgi:hypothetical protein